MVEGLIAWVLLIVGIIHESEMVLVAAGIFAVATNLSRIGDALKER